VKRNSIYLRSKLSDRELSLLKLDLVNNSIYFVSKIKNLNLDESIIEEIVKNAVEQILSNYKFGQDGSLGDLVKTAVIVDLKHYYENTYPDQANKVLWPNLDKRAPFDKLLEVLEKLRLQPIPTICKILSKVDNKLNKRQQDILYAIYSGNPDITYAEVSKRFGKRGVMTYREIKIIYTQLTQVSKEMGIEI
jgi:hypothetical protein